MIFVTGGRFCGKTDFVRKEFNIEAEKPENIFTAPAVRDFHLYIKENEIDVDEILRKNSGVIIIADEIGSGIVPLSKEDRDYRERVGRVCCEIAKKADAVYRVVCGIGVRIA